MAGKKRGTGSTIKEQEKLAIFGVLEYLRGVCGLEMSSQQLSRYLDYGRVRSEINRLKRSKEFRSLESEERGEFLNYRVHEYVLKNKTFNENGIRLIENSLEDRAKKSVLRDIFSTKKGRQKRYNRAAEEYLNTREAAGEIYNIVAQNPESYSKESPELVEAAHNLERISRKSELAEILMAAGRLGKKSYENIKSGLRDYSRRVVDLSREYVESPVTSYSTLIVGLALIVIFYQVSSTGAVIGVLSKSSSLFFIGIGLLFISGLSFIFRRKNKKRKI